MKLPLRMPVLNVSGIAIQLPILMHDAAAAAAAAAALMIMSEFASCCCLVCCSCCLLSIVSYVVFMRHAVKTSCMCSSSSHRMQTAHSRRRQLQNRNGQLRCMLQVAQVPDSAKQ